MSLSPNPEGSGFLRQQQGKTPPPAPSAAYARRAREMQAEGGLGARYRPPALRASQGLAASDVMNGGFGINPGLSSQQQSGLGSASLQRPQPLTPIDDTTQHSDSYVYPASYRRARAGTLPSNVQLAAQNFASSMTGLSGIDTGVGYTSSGNGNHSLASSPIGPLHPPSSASILSGGDPSVRHGVSGSTRPSLRHAASAAPAPASSFSGGLNSLASIGHPGTGGIPSLSSGGLASLGPSHVGSGVNGTNGGERTSRLRSGSLTLPQGGLGDAFGSGLFSSSSWLPSNGNGNNRDPGFGTLDELRSLASADSQTGEDYDVHTVHTLDYLGLDDDGSRRGSKHSIHAHNGHPIDRERSATSANLHGLAALQQAQQQQQQQQQYLGPAPRMVEMRDPNSAAALNASNRLRANTVANPYRRAQRTASSRIIPDVTHDEEEEYSSGDNYGQQPMTPSSLGVPSYNRQRLDSYEGSGYISGGSDHLQQQQQQYVARGFPKGTADHLASSARTRSTSLGTADEQGVRRRVNMAMNMTVIDEPGHNDIPAPLSSGGAYTSKSSNYRVGSAAVNYNDVPILGQPQYQMMHPQSQSQQGNGGNALLRQLHGDASSQQQQQTGVRFPSQPVENPPMNGRSGSQRESQGRTSPKDSSAQAQGGQGQGPAQIQTPNRSLWIGNLDSSMSGEDLARAFAPYGAIESYRLLPEKECGFINFVDIEDAIRAKDDVLNRLGGSIGQTNGQTVRIGFGKADSAPATPSGPNSGGTHSSHFLSSHSASGSRDSTGTRPGAGGDANGMDAQLQSAPTRALWIGSIPSTTTPATILSVFSPFGPIESARVLTHKNCGFVNFERLDDAVRARKALNGRDVLGSDVGAIRIGFARVPVKNAGSNSEGEDGAPGSTAAAGIQGVGDLTVGATIHTLRGIKGASAVAADQQVLGGAVENYRSNLLLSMLGSISNLHAAAAAASTNGVVGAGSLGGPPVTEQQMIMRMLGDGSNEPEVDLSSLADFRPPMAYYTSIPVAGERTNPRRWDASKLRELRKRLDSGSCTIEEIDDVASDFLDGEIVDLASDWLGNTVVQKLFEKCSPAPRLAMLERVAPHLAMIGIHKNGTWAAQKVIECSSSPEEITLIAINLRPYTPPLLLDQFGNYVVQCCLRFGSPANDFIFDAMTDRLWEIAQGRFGARSMRTCLESPYITIHQQRRIATAVILNSIPLATNPNGALLLTWLLDTSGFHNRYSLLAPRFTPHLSHLCTHKLASVTVLRIVNQKSEPEASKQLVQSLFNSPGDHVLTDVLGDQINGVAVVHKILQSSFLDMAQRPSYLEATKRVLIDLKVTTAQAYRRLIEEVGLPIPSFSNSQPPYGGMPNAGSVPTASKKPSMSGMNMGMHGGYPQQPHGAMPPPMPYSPDMNDPNLVASMMGSMHLNEIQSPAARAMQHQHQPRYPPPMPMNPAMPYGVAPPMAQQASIPSTVTFSPSTDPFLPLPLRGDYAGETASPVQPHRAMYGQPQAQHRPGSNGATANEGGFDSSHMYSTPGPGAGPSGMGGGQPTANGMMSPAMSMSPQISMAGTPYGVPPPMPPHMYQAYMYQLYQQQQQQQQHPNPGYQQQPPNGGYQQPPNSGNGYQPPPNSGPY